MLTLIEALNFRCLNYVRQPLGSFHVLVGPNASGKTTFLDVVALLGELVSEGLTEAIEGRTHNFHDLVWRRSGDSFELAIEARIPDDRRRSLSETTFDRVRYEVKLGLETESGEISILSEKALLKAAPVDKARQLDLFPAPPQAPETIQAASKGAKIVVNKVRDGNDNFYDETGGKWNPAFKLGPRKSALGNLPEDESKFPVCTWLKALLVTGVQRFVLNSLLLRKASPPGQVRGFKSDGSNLPWVAADLQRRAPERFADWVAHLGTALPDLESIRIVEREDDKHRYLVLGYRGGLEVPSWMASDGTLRLLALTLPAYLNGLQGIYLIEEPENGIHPRAVETMFHSLSSVYSSQVLLATHSPVILSVADPKDVLCFAKSREGATDIVTGENHPALRAWHGETNLGVLFASGILG